MDFVRALDVVGGFLTAACARHAIAGGVALAAYGHPRLTLDLDIVTDAQAQAALVKSMESAGYETLYRSQGFSNHRHPDRALGRVDFIYVGGTTATRLFANVRQLPGPGGRSIAVPSPEHLIAMKVQAIKNAPERTWQEMVDIGYLLKLPDTNRGEARDFFVKAGLQEHWDELERHL